MERLLKFLEELPGWWGIIVFMILLVGVGTIFQSYVDFLDNFPVIIKSILFYLILRYLTSHSLKSNIVSTD